MSNTEFRVKISEMSDNSGLPLVRPTRAPLLDRDYRPAALANRFFRKAASQSDKTVKVALALERADGEVSYYQTHVLLPEHPMAEANFIYLERLLKCLLWVRGAWKVHFCGPAGLAQKLRKHFKTSPTGKFDAKILGERVYEHPFQLVSVAEADLPPEHESAASRGRHWDGCRLGFDLGASDRKVAAVKDGRVVFSAEYPWDPRNHNNPQWHFDQIMDMLKTAATHLPRVDAIGGSSAGVLVDNRVKVASLFRAVPEDQFQQRVKPIFLELRKAWNDIPFEVVNDGDVTALAGSMSIGENNVLGIALGSSQAAGYVNAAGQITSWLNELAFAPIDYNPDAPRDEWSGDYGCGAQYFSQQAVNRLIPCSTLEIADDMPLPEKLLAVQEFMKQGDERAEAIYQTLGTYLGYSLPHYAEFYDFKHLLLLGRVTTGHGGTVMVETAKKILADEFPDFPLEFHLPDEKEKRHGQAKAAASLPAIG